MDFKLPDNMRVWCHETSETCNIHNVLFGASDKYIKSLSFETGPVHNRSYNFELSLHMMSKEQMEDIIKVVRSWSNKGE